jgi:hypothetical protein
MSVLVLLFRSRASLEAEILSLVISLTSSDGLCLSCHGSPDLCWAVSFGARYPQGADACEAGDRRPSASCRLQIVLALEVTTSFRPTDGSDRNTAADPRDEHGQSAVGSAADPWRVAQAWHRDRPDQRRQVYGTAKEPAVQGGRRSCALMPTASRRSICSSCRRSHSGCCMAY